MIEAAALHELMGKWWFSYDEGDFDALKELLTDDVHFSARTDSPEVAWAEFVRADLTGKDDVMEWHIDHRVNSPYPLRHHGSNAHFTEHRASESAFAMYIDVSQIVNEMPSPLPGGVVHGVIRKEPDALRIAALELVLDTMESKLFSEVRT